MYDLIFQDLKITGIKKKEKVYGKKGIFSNKIKDYMIFSEKELDELEKIAVENVLVEQNIEKIDFYRNKSNMLNSIKLINGNFKLETVLKMTEEALCELLNSDGASILLFNEEKKVLNFYITSGGASGNIETIDVPLEGSIAGECFKNKQTMIINDAQNNPKHFKKTDKESKYITKNLIATSLIVDGKPIGVIEAVNKNEDYNIEDKSVIELFSSLISNKLMNSKIYEDLSSTIKGIILAVATAIDLRDRYTHTHSNNVSKISVAIGEELGFSDSFLEELEISALLHDVGKIGIPDEVLNKPNKLTEEEYKIIQSHTLIGADLLSEIDFLSKNISLGALEHHEKLDGSGYPYHKKNDEISLFGKLLAVADIYDALTAKRIYKDPWPKEKVLNMLKKDCPTKFDCNIVNALEKRVP
jgi:HD-GYP domain-containing protein (c-di-GMP phosphodiesterase class II)